MAEEYFTNQGESWGEQPSQGARPRDADLPSFRPLSPSLAIRSGDRRKSTTANKPPFLVIRDDEAKGRAALHQWRSLPAPRRAGVVGPPASKWSTAAFLRAFLILVIGVGAGYVGSFLRPAPAHVASDEIARAPARGPDLLHVGVPGATPDATALATDPSFPIRSQATSGDERLGQAAIVALKRGDESLRIGDIVSARRFYEFAASAGSAEAATAVALTYDPAYLKAAGVRGVKASVETARDWYEKAARQGDARAAQRLQSLERK
jgi:hypothetical protein